MGLKIFMQLENLDTKSKVFVIENLDKYRNLK